MTDSTHMRTSQRIVSCLLAASLTLGGGIALAQDEERKTKQTVAMSQQVYEKLTEIQTLRRRAKYMRSLKMQFMHMKNSACRRLKEVCYRLPIDWWTRSANRVRFATWLVPE